MSGPYTQTGIELAQQGRKAEALAYLRRAVTSEPLTADVWLWLAHVTSDPNEYRNCVYQALRLQPDHATARRMQVDLEYQSYGASPPVAASQAVQKLEKKHKRQRRWRRLLILLNALLILAGMTRVALWASERFSPSEFIPFLEENKRLQFAVGPEDSALSFQVEVPRSWSLADRGSPSWRTERDRLEKEFPAEAGLPNLWREMQTDLGEVTLSPVNGALSKPVAIVETDSDKIEANAQFPATLMLMGVQPLPATYANTGCLTIGELAEAQGAAAAGNPSFVKADVRARTSDDCIYYLIYEDESTQFWQIIVPVGADRLATWQITLPAELADEYDKAVNRILESIRYLEPNA